MATESFTIVQNFYADQLKQDVREYEESTRINRLRRVDEGIRAYAALEFTKGSVTQKFNKEVIDIFDALDTFIEQDIPDFRSHDRLNKAMSYFKANPDKLPGAIGQYYQVREEAWAGRG